MPTVVLKTKTSAATTSKQGSSGSPENSTCSSVSFTAVGAFPNIRVLSAFLHDGEIVACGGLSNDDVLLTDCRVMNLGARTVTAKRRMLLTAKKNFRLHTLNIPKDFLQEGEANQSCMSQRLPAGR